MSQVNAPRLERRQAVLQVRRRAAHPRLELGAVVREGVPEEPEEAVTRDEQKAQRRGRVDIMWERAERCQSCDVLIFGKRYCGAYEGAPWVALLADPEWLDDFQAGDNACKRWWKDYAEAPIGRGDSPNEALESLRI